VNPKTILITGVAGFLGSNLAERLLQEGHKVVGVDNLSMGHLSNIKNAMMNPLFEFVQGDVTDAEMFANLSTEIEVLVHLAAFKIPRYGKAIDTLKINLHGTENTLDFAKDRNIKCVLASTSDVYGKNPAVPLMVLTRPCHGGVVHRRYLSMQS